jgi:hypothetical protein
MNKDNLPEEYQPTEGEVVPDWARMPTGAPEEFGVDGPAPANGNPSTKNYAVEKRRVWQRQEAFLEAYRKCGKIGKAAQAVGLTRWAVDHWLRNDTFSFKERINMAHADYVEAWEEWMDNRLENPQGNKGSDVLGMFKLKAEAPDKYREEVKVVGIEASKAMMERLRQMAMKEREALERGQVVEGEMREVDDKEGQSQE